MLSPGQRIAEMKRYFAALFVSASLFAGPVEAADKTSIKFVMVARWRSGRQLPRLGALPKTILR
jgi:hypothetical protein